MIYNVCKTLFFTGKHGLQVFYLELTSQALLDLILCCCGGRGKPHSPGVPFTVGIRILLESTGPSHRRPCPHHCSGRVGAGRQRPRGWVGVLAKTLPLIPLSLVWYSFLHSSVDLRQLYCRRLTRTFINSQRKTRFLYSKKFGQQWIKQDKTKQNRKSFLWGFSELSGQLGGKGVYSMPSPAALPGPHSTDTIWETLT